jgi:Fe-S-cluster containining protein
MRITANNTCDQCGTCCKLFLINLSEQEYLSGKYQTVNSEFGGIKDFAEAEKYGLNFLAQKEDGSCIYLMGQRCSIHDHRPQVCRNFFCKGTEPEFETMRREIKAYKNQ